MYRKSLKKTFFCLILCLLFSVGVQSNTFTCNCQTFKNYLDFYEYNNYEMIFEGTVESIKRGDTNIDLIAKFHVSKIHKGQTKLDTLSILTTKGGPCGLNFQIGDKWLIYADNDGILSSGVEFFSDRCTRSKPIHSSFNTRVKVFRERKFLKKYKSYTGTISTKDSKGELINGLPHGRWDYHDGSGAKVIVDKYNHGVIDGVLEYYHKNGYLYSKLEYHNGDRFKITIYHEDGTIRQVYE